MQHFFLIESYFLNVMPISPRENNSILEASPWHITSILEASPWDITSILEASPRDISVPLLQGRPR